MRWYLWILLVVISAWAQVDLVKQQAEINSAKADLEEVRKARDVAVAKRWQDRQKANEEREHWNQKIAELREKVDLAANERARYYEELRAMREDLAQVKQEQEKARTGFLMLSAQDNRVHHLTQALERGSSLSVPERMQRANQLRKKIQSLRDNPGQVARYLLMAMVHEMQFSRQVEWGEGDLSFAGGYTERGQRVRLGAIGAAQFGTQSQKVALMLPSAGERGRVFTWQDKLTPEITMAVRKAFHQSRDSLHVFLPVDVLLSTSLTSEMVNQRQMTWQDEVRKLFKDGGVLMFPILGLFGLALLFALERMVVIFWEGRAGRRALQRIVDDCEKGSWLQAQEKAQKLPGVVGQVVRAVLTTQHLPRLSGEKALEEVFTREVPRLEKRLGAISVFGATAPLLGLLGTVMGMIELFKVITLYGTSDPKMLAGGISIALVTTQTGLAVAIPVQLIHTWISNRVENLINRMENTGHRLLNIAHLKDSVHEP